LVGDAPAKRWWRHFRTADRVWVCRGHQRVAGTARLVDVADPAYPEAWRTYYDRHHVARQDTDRLLLIETTQHPLGAA